MLFCDTLKTLWSGYMKNRSVWVTDRLNVPCLYLWRALCSSDHTENFVPNVRPDMCCKGGGIVQQITQACGISLCHYLSSGTENECFLSIGGWNFGPGEGGDSWQNHICVVHSLSDSKGQRISATSVPWTSDLGWDLPEISSEACPSSVFTIHCILNSLLIYLFLYRSSFREETRFYLPPYVTTPVMLNEWLHSWICVLPNNGAAKTQNKDVEFRSLLSATVTPKVSHWNLLPWKSPVEPITAMN